MPQLGWHVDIDACIACRGCEAACKQEFALPGGIRRRRVLVREGTAPSGRPYRQHVTQACMHCAQPACVAVCPVKRYWKDTDENTALRAALGILANPPTGLVLIMPSTDQDPEIGVDCIRCRRCVAACPQGAVRVDDCRTCRQCKGGMKHPGGGRPAEKCTGCYHRLFNAALPAERRRPACVLGCSSLALRFEELEGMEGYRTTWGGAPPADTREVSDPEMTNPSVRYRPQTLR
jgi:Fe-S-cluster-containing dehydrogenase component